MSRKNEDSIEKFFRKGVRQSDTTFRESDWLALEKRLEEHAQVRAATRARMLRQMAVGGAGILLISVSLFFFLPDAERESTVHSPQSTVSAERKSTDHPPTPGFGGRSGSQTTVNAENQATANTEEKSTDYKPQSMANAERESGSIATAERTRSTADNTLEADAHKGAGVRGKEPIAGHTQRPNVQAPAADRGTQRAADSPLTGAAGQDIRTAGVQQTPSTTTQDQHTTTTRKPRLSKRSEATAVTKPVTPQPTVANASERPARAPQPDTDATGTGASSTVDTPQATTVTDKYNQSVKDRSATATAPPSVANREAGRSASTVAPADPGVAHPTDELATPVAEDREKSSTADRRQSPVGSGADTITPPSPVDTRSTVDARDATPTADTTQTSTVSEQKTVASQPAAAEKKKDDKPRIASRWNAAVMIAPDFSSTGLGAEMSAPGRAYGAQIGYRLSRKFTVLSGVIRSSKKYVGYGKDYKPPYGYWERRTNGVVPDEIQGSCTIVEIPITVQYDVWQSARARLYIAGGVTSYYMRHEKYDYRFNEPNAGADGSWSTDVSSSYAFKVGHFSAAYEIMLNKNLGVSVEPYIKIPFQGIGWANISLYTTGAYINARYFFSRKNPE